jgi:NitT/TauT family transport system substrate-binding protein
MTYDRDFSRRDMLKMLSLAGSAGLLAACAKAADRGASGDSGTAVASDKDEKLETTSIRLVMDPRFTVLCYAPQYLADKYLKEEGFTNVEYVSKIDGSEAQALLHGDADISSALAVDWIMPISKGEPVVVLGGLHPGCVEIFANKSITTMKDLKGKRIGVSGLQSPERFLLASIVSYIGLDPEKDIEWVFAEPLQWGPMLVDGKVDALAAFPPMNQGLHEAKIGTVLLNTLTDDPWKNYFCCMLATNRSYLEKNPVATKRALRAIMRAAELAGKQPDVAAQRLADMHIAENAPQAHHVMTRLPYHAWRSYDPADSMRFYALRLREAGLITQTPQEILDRGSNWGIINALKKEMPA